MLAVRQRSRLQAIEACRTAHGFRHAHTAELRAEDVDVAIIRRQLGHASLATTIRYLDHLCPAAVVRAIQARVW